MIIDCKKIRQEKLEQIKKEVIELKSQGITPSMTIITCEGFDKASSTYITNKYKTANECGIEVKQCNVPWECESKDKIINFIVQEIIRCNNDDNCSGYFIQMPLPNIEISDFSDYILWYKDLDGFSDENIGRSITNKECIEACTPQGIMAILDNYKLSGKSILIINRSHLIGMPLIPLSLRKDATVTVAHSKTKDLDMKIKHSDIVITGVGVPNFIGGRSLVGGQIVVDVSINRDKEGKLCGDIMKSEYDMLNNMRIDFSSVPGGVGILTTTFLMANVVKCCKIQNKLNGGM